MTAFRNRPRTHFVVLVLDGVVPPCAVLSGDCLVHKVRQPVHPAPQQFEDENDDEYEDD